MITFTFDEIEFSTHPSGAGGFEGDVSFSNNFRMKIVCGPASYHTEEPELLNTPGEYTRFDYWIHKPIDYIEPIAENWIGPNSKEELVAMIQSVANRPYVDGWYGGVGEAP
jgi:hypothetical protein